MRRPADLLVGIVALLVALTVGLMLFLTPFLVPVLGAVVATLTSILLVWHTRVWRIPTGPHSIVLARPPWALLAVAFLLVGCFLIPLFITLDVQSTVWLFIPVFIGILLYVAYLPMTLLLWNADAEGLTQQLLSSKKMLRWQDIDWVYGASNETTQKAFEVLTIAKWKEQTLIVEAGPNATMRILLRAPLVGGNFLPLIEAIRQRAHNALFGFDQLPSVDRRRHGQQYVPETVVVPAGDLTQAAKQARAGVIPSTWTVFSVSRKFAWLNLFSLSLLGPGLIITAIYLFINNTLLIESFISKNLPPSTLSAIAIGQLLVLIAAGIWLLVTGVGWLRPLRDQHYAFFLVTPEAFAEAKGRSITGAKFRDVRSVILEGGGFYGQQIVVTLRTGKKLSFDIGPNYGPVRNIHAYLLAGYLTQTKPSQARGPMGATMHSETELSG